MRTSVLLLGAAMVLTLADCTGSNDGAAGGNATGSGATTSSGGTTSTGATTGSGGTTGSGATTSSGGTMSSGAAPGTGGSMAATGGSTALGGTTSAGGSGATGGGSGGVPMGGMGATGGSVTTGGQPETGGAPPSGGMPGVAGSVASGGMPPAGGNGGSAGTGNPPAYQGPCDLLSGGCAEAYSVTRAMTANYKGPLFQLGIASDKNAKTLDIGQTADHTADMTTWNAYCGGSASKCVVSKIYAQIHSGPNDLLPAVWNAPWGPNCSAGGYTCAANFTIESSTNLPILTTVGSQEYALSGDNFATGVNGGSKAIGLMYNGKPVPNQNYCCGVFGITHKYNANDTFGTDFMLALAYGWKDSGGCCIAVNCGKSNSYCVGAEEEENNDLYDYGTSPVDNALVVTQFDPTKNAVVTFMNGTQVLSHSPPKAQINAGTAVHLGGGGDLSHPDQVIMREAYITNALLSASDVTALKANVQAFYPSLKFP